jgi:hypothetical protein
MDQREALKELKARYPKIAADLRVEFQRGAGGLGSLCKVYRHPPRALFREALGSGAAWDSALAAVAQYIGRFHSEWL